MGWSGLPPDAESELDRAIKRGDRERVVELAWVGFRRRLTFYALEQGVHPDDVDDVLQEVFSRVLEGWDHFDRRRLYGWLRKVTCFEARTWRQRRVREGWRTEELWADALLLARQQAVADSHSDLVRVFDVVDRLDATNRSVFVASFIYELTDLETVGYVFQKTGRLLSREAVRWRRSRIRNRVRATLVEGDP